MYVGTYIVSLEIVTLIDTYYTYYVKHVIRKKNATRLGQSMILNEGKYYDGVLSLL